ncbi:uncharacterized protein [Rutidosis leptorrhynchoides]|uniref:uncharacterized protein n=1 Tax=Rutidosis leptorrhynchoides TaxID=125765 RepID=UPI003A99088A
MSTTNKYEKIYTVTSVTHLIPIKLDLTKLNYTHLSQLFSNHCAAFNVDSFLAATTSSDPPSEEWKKADTVVMGWIFLTISEPLLERLLNSHPTSSHAAWEFLKNVSLDNSRSKIIKLITELRSLNIGDSTTEAYFRRIDSISAMLTNLGSNIKDEELVTYAINGLNDRFPHATHIIRHRSPFPDLNIVRYMITLEDMQLQRKNRVLNDSQGTPSAPTALLAQAASSISPRASNTTTQVCHNFSRGHCRFGEKCRYIHQVTQPSRTGNSNPVNNNIFNRTTEYFSFWATDSSGPSYWPTRILATPQANYAGLISSVTPNHLLSLALNSPYGFNFPGQFFPGPQTTPTSNQSAQFASGPGQALSGSSQPSSLLVGHSQVSPYALTAQSTQETSIPNAFSTTTLPDYGNSGWIMDIGASTHLTSSINNLSIVFNHCMYPSITVGDGNSIPVTNTGHSVLSNINRPLHLPNVLVTPNIVKNLISVRKFARDIKVSVSFDEFGFSVKDYLTRRLLLRNDSTGDLYLLTPQPPTVAHHALLTTPSIWHQRLGHLSTDVFRHLISSNSIACNNTKYSVLCHACQLGKHARLSFSSYVSHVTSLFDIVHSDLWASPIPNLSGYKYYVLFLDHYSHYLWVFPLRNKSEVFENFNQFRTYIKTQFNSEIKAFQCDNGGEFDNKQLLQLFKTNGIQVRFSCPYSSQQNGKSERMIRTIINLIRTLLFQAHLPPTFWVEALHMATYLLNLLPSSAINHEVPHTHLRAGALQYLTFTRPDISYAVQQICLFMHDPREPHLAALRRILRYIHGTMDLGLQLHVSSTTSMVAYSDADWAGCPTTRRSTSGYYVFLGDNLLSWSSKRRQTPSRSSAEAEYRCVANAVAETCWIRNLLRELHCPLFSATLVYCDNVSAVYMSSNPVQHQRTKHIEIDIHFVRDLVTKGHVRVLHVPSRYQYADIFTEGLPTALFNEFRTSLSVRATPAPTAGNVCRYLDHRFIIFMFCKPKIIRAHILVSSNWLAS